MRVAVIGRHGILKCDGQFVEMHLCRMPFFGRKHDGEWGRTRREGERRVVPAMRAFGPGSQDTLCSGARHFTSISSSSSSRCADTQILFCPCILSLDDSSTPSPHASTVDGNVGARSHTGCTSRPFSPSRMSRLASISVLLQLLTHIFPSLQPMSTPTISRRI